jgi:hypothetical protein
VENDACDISKNTLARETSTYQNLSTDLNNILEIHSQKQAEVERKTKATADSQTKVDEQRRLLDFALGSKKSANAGLRDQVSSLQEGNDNEKKNFNQNSIAHKGLASKLATLEASVTQLLFQAKEKKASSSLFEIVITKSC